MQLEQKLYQAFGDSALGVWQMSGGSGTSIPNLGSFNSGQPATITGGTWTTDGPSGKAAVTFTSGNRVSIGGNIDSPTSMTVAVWIRTTSAVQQPIFSNRVTFGGQLYFGTSGGRLFVYSYSGSLQSHLSNALVNDGKWHHVVWTSNGTVAKMYIDGKLDNQANNTRSVTTGPGYIGYYGENNESFNGSITGVYLYDQYIP